MRASVEAPSCRAADPGDREQWRVLRLQMAVIESQELLGRAVQEGGGGVSAIIVTYFTGPLLKRCLATAEADPAIDEIIRFSRSSTRIGSTSTPSAASSSRSVMP